MGYIHLRYDWGAKIEISVYGFASNVEKQGHLHTLMSV